jgi:hypothetical protein
MNLKGKCNYGSLLMVRIAKKSDPVKLRELKEKINDEEYLTLAIQRIAMLLSSELLGMNEESK